MKKLFTLAFLLMSLGLSAQSYYNEWIDYSKTYYKFKVGSTGLYRIPASVLAGAGMGSVISDNFQLFRNGQEVPIYVTAASGQTLGSGDYIEFWGQMNDGVPDAPLYRSAAYQHTQHWSLESDTATYFLTVNTSGNAFHYENTANNVASSTLTPEPYFMYTTGSYYHLNVNPGFAQVVGEYVYSSSYDIGEWWGSQSIYPGNPYGDQQTNLAVYTGGPGTTITFGLDGQADNSRTCQVTINGTVVADSTMNSFADWKTTRSFPLSLISGNTATLSFINNSTNASDRMVASYYEINYPRQFNFGGKASFPFSLAAKASGYLLNITNFSIASGVTPVLYDMTNGLRFSGVVSGSTVSFALPGTTQTSNYVLVNEGTITNVTSLTQKNFQNLTLTANQGNYLIISNPLLYTGTSGNNPVADYKAYRSSASGGSWDAQYYDINELVDQFGYGIKKHPLAIQNFLKYARAKFTTKPQFVFLIGHGCLYTDYYANGEQNHDPMADVMNMVPTFGNPASDNKLSAANGVDAVPITPIGRLSVTSGAEIEDYLEKIKEYDLAQTTSPSTIDGRLWMKSVVHLTGASEAYLGTILCNYMTSYASIISDTLYGANINQFCDGNASAVSSVPANIISTLFAQGFGMLCYFGHSSNSTLGYNLDNPQDYDNQGKYAVWFANGCDAGDFFVYDAARPGGADETLSETYVLAKERGAIAFVASTHYGIVNYLNILLYGLYNYMDRSDYGKPLGILQKDALQNLMNVAPNDYFSRLHAEEMTTHGDPALKLNQLPTDYDIEASQVVINPSFVSVSNTSFEVKAKIFNLGKAVNDSVVVQVKRTYPDGTSTMLLNKKIRGIRYADSIDIQVPIIATRDKGDNKITISVDPGQTIPEVTYANNTYTADVFIYQDGATPVYPYNYAIINTPTSKLIASTANALATLQTYTFQIDTSRNFNSPIMVSKTVNSIGGELELDPGITYMDSVVYYWRVAPQASGNAATSWGNASFIYIDPAHSTVGFNQSHYFQHMDSQTDSITMTANRQWAFTNTTHNVYLRNCVYEFTQNITDGDFATGIDGSTYIMSACVGQSLIFNVINPITYKAWLNTDANGNNLYLSGSGSANCKPGETNWNFEFSYMTQQSRYMIMRFMDSIPDGYVVTIRTTDYDDPNGFPKTWEGDTTYYGHNKSLYHYLINAGLVQIDSLNSIHAWEMIYKKNDNTFTPVYNWTSQPSERITLSANITGLNYTGMVTSPQIGPAKKWGMVHWRGHSLSNPVTDTVGVQILGVDTLGNATTLYQLNRTTQDYDISATDPNKYPYLKFKMTTTDSVHAKPYQLDYWRANYTPVAEGALAPNLVLKAPDTVVLGQPMEFEIAFKNISPYNFDSTMSVKMYILDRSNVMHTITIPRRKTLVSGDTVIVDYQLDTKAFTGANTLYVDFNPNYAQPEQYTFNNFLYKTFYVKGDSRNPTLDVTFDNVHILNDDIVSAKPHIQIKLTSQSQYLLLTDTSLIKVQVQYPDGSLHSFGFNSDTLRFTPATSASNNVATVDFTPAFTKQYNADGDTYTLIVSGKDELGNTAGTTPYRVAFKIINKAMISNMLNYPNPFTTSTAFVFTITGSTVPQNIKIQILTITGHIVREITKEELGPLHVGRNITEGKWNGTDQYGNRLANGVYLYHVVTNLNGKSLDKYTATGDNTDKFFVNGYGKMYLMGK